MRPVLLVLGAYALILLFAGVDYFWHGPDAGFHTLTVATTGFGIGFLLKKFAG